MHMISRSLAAVCLAAVAAAAPSSARAGDPRTEQAEELALEAMQKFMRALELMIDSIPQYELPEITEDGDIIIRRRREAEPAQPDSEPAPPGGIRT